MLQRIAGAMDEVLREARRDSRVPKELLVEMKSAWHDGMAHAR
jgi:hypothetical protein